MQVDNLTLTTHQGRILINNLSFYLNKSDRLAIIGDEGNGKSTLIKALYDPSLVNSYVKVEGNINYLNAKVGYLPQFLDEKYLDYSVYDYLIEEIKDKQEYEKIGDLYVSLSLLKIDTRILESEQVMSTLSGGEKIKIQLAKLLIQHYDVLLLDEPTNDIDLETLHWLEDFIKSAPAAIIFISHDETLLKKCATTILHLRLLKRKKEPDFILENMGYDEYASLYERNFENQFAKAMLERRIKKEKEAVLRKLHSKVEHRLNQAVRSPSEGRLLAKRMKVVTGQEKKLDKQVLTDIPLQESAINVSFQSEKLGVHSSFKVLELNDYTLRIEDRVLATNLNLTIVGNQKVGLIGKNGSGKTTLLKKIKIDIEQKKLKVGYLPQNYLEQLNDNDSCIKYLQSFIGYEKDDLTMIRSYLGALNFTSDEMVMPIYNLSGGQKCKLCLVKILLENNDVLLLDEPTRNLSPLSLPYIRQLFASYSGVIIAISHDRLFLKEVMKIIYQLDKNGLTLIEHDTIN